MDSHKKESLTWLGSPWSLDRDYMTVQMRDIPLESKKRLPPPRNTSVRCFSCFQTSTLDSPHQQTIPPACTTRRPSSSIHQARLRPPDSVRESQHPQPPNPGSHPPHHRSLFPILPVLLEEHRSRAGSDALWFWRHDNARKGGESLCPSRHTYYIYANPRRNEMSVTFQPITGEKLRELTSSAYL